MIKIAATGGVLSQQGRGLGQHFTAAEMKSIVETASGLNAAVKAGEPIAFGTDAGVFEHGRNAEEFALMVEKGGMTPRAALVSATVDAAALMGLSDETGTIAVGKSADIIAVEGDPLSNPRALEKMRFVMAAGRTIALD